MQVNAGTAPGSKDMSGVTSLADWNDRSPAVDIEVLINGFYQKKSLYLFESDPPHGITSSDFSIRKMRYPSNGLKTISSYRDSINWSIRKLIYKQYDLGVKGFVVKYHLKGGSKSPKDVTSFAIKKPDLRPLDETVRRYGDITKEYPIHVFRMRDEGIGTRGNGDEYRWPRLTNDKARH